MKAEQTLEEKELAAVFERLTEASSTLMDAGELDVYSTSRQVSPIQFSTCNNFNGLVLHHKHQVQVRRDFFAASSWKGV